MQCCYKYEVQNKSTQALFVLSGNAQIHAMTKKIVIHIDVIIFSEHHTFVARNSRLVISKSHMFP